jgi:glycosyltransferase involved in cell wall biosynthesis
MSAPQRPLVSVIIPAYYSAGTIPACLEALRRQTCRSFEVIMVNSSPESHTESLVRRQYPEVQFEQHPERLLPHEARNRGAALARGDLFVFTDPDCDADPCWLERLVSAFKEDCQALVGAMELSSHSLWEQAVHLIKFHWLLCGLGPGTKFCAPTANAAYTRRLWVRIGPFPDGYYAADGILSYRAALAGHPPRFVPSAVVRHRHLDPAISLFRQRFSRGRDYARAQLCAMGEPGLSAWLRLIFSWAALPLVLARAGRDASRCGWVRPYLLTLPVQAVGHGLWEFGESCGALELLVRRCRPAGAK